MAIGSGSLAMAKNTTVVWASFPSHEVAEQMRERLTAQGYARNSIEIFRQGHDEGCDLAVHTSEENLQDVESLLHTSAPVYALRQMRSGVIKTAAANPLVIGGGIALAGLVLYSLLPRNRRSTVHSIRQLPRTVRRLPEALFESVRVFPETARELAAAVSTAMGDQDTEAELGGDRRLSGERDHRQSPRTHGQP
jgi:hypothetical protein